MQTLLAQTIALIDCDPSSPLIPALDAETADIVATQKPDGQWPDVNYQDDAPSAWATAIHLQRTLLLATIARCPVSRFHGNATVAAAATLAAQWWIGADPINSNWWWGSFGTTLLVAKFLLLQPNATLLAAAEPIFARCTIADVVGFTGANRVWAAQVNVLQGLLYANASLVNEAFTLMHEAYAVAPIEDSDGFMPDGSFHQHGPLLYGGYGYGSHLTVNALAMETAALGTPWTMPAAGWQVLSTFLLEGAAWAGRGGEWDMTASGRHNTYYLAPNAWGVYEGHYHFFAAYLPFVMAFPTGQAPFATPLSITPVQLFPPFFGYPNGTGIKGFYDRVVHGDMTQSPVGDRHYPDSDYHVHARPEATFVVRTFSNRTLNSECLNGEGLQNQGMADGVLLVYQTGHEYSNAVQAWNWSLVPGTTELQTGQPLLCGDTQAVNHTAFVGGVSDGSNGAVAFDFARDAGGCSLVASKAWFLVDGVAAALGSGIKTNAGCRLATTTSMEQRPLDDRGVWYAATPAAAPALLPPQTPMTIAGQPWLWHDNVTYASLADQSTWVFSNKDRNGSWSFIAPAPPVYTSMPQLHAFVEHGASPSNATYAYLVIPAVPTPQQAAVAVQNLPNVVTVIANSPDAQAVCWRNVSSAAWVLQGVFWTAGAVTAFAECPALSADTPSIVSLTPASGAGASTVLTLSASNPMVEVRPLSAKYTVAGRFVGACCSPAPDGASSVFSVAFPSGISGGATVQCACTSE